MLYESLLKSRVGEKVGIIRVIGCDENSGVSDYPVACLRKILPIVIGLKTVIGDGVTRKPRATGSKFWRPPKHGNGDHWLRIAIFAIGDECVARRRRSCGRIGKTFEIPVGSTIVRVDQPII